MNSRNSLGNELFVGSRFLSVIHITNIQTVDDLFNLFALLVKLSRITHK